MRSLVVMLSTLSVTGAALADAPPEPRRKDVPYGIVVDNIAEITEHAIVLYPWHERAGAPWTLGVFEPGVELAVDPDGPAPRLFRVKKDRLGSLRVEVEKAKGFDKGMTLASLAGTDCGLPLPRHEQVVESSKAIRVRRHVEIDTHLLCEMKGGKREYVEGDSGAPSSAPTASSPPPAPSATPAAAPARSAGCGSCGVGERGTRDLTATLMVALLLSSSARRRGSLWR